MPPLPIMKSIEIKGFRPFKEFQAELGPLEVIVGANAAGKSSFFEFLRFLRDSMKDQIPPEIVAGSLAREVFHSAEGDPFGGMEFSWMLGVVLQPKESVVYSGEVRGPLGRPSISHEHAGTQASPDLITEGGEFFQRLYRGDVEEDGMYNVTDQENRLALSLATSYQFGTLHLLRGYLAAWQFYSSFNINNDKVRRSALIEQAPSLREDASNLSAVLHYLLTEHREAFEEIEQHLRTIIPGFKRLTVKARGDPGEVIAFWNEKGVEGDLPLADLSDGVIRLLSWITLCLHPSPPPLICIDEPDQGVHPRTLPLLAGLFRKAAERTQVLLATHSSYFLVQFDLSEIAVIRKVNGAAEFFKPADSAVLRASLEDFGSDEIEAMHRSDELERLS